MNKRYLFSIAFFWIIVAACNDSDGSAKSSSDSIPGDSIQSVEGADNSGRAESIDDTVFADGSVPSSWENAGISNPLAVKQFIQKLQTWVETGNSDSIAAHIQFPLKNPPVQTIGEFRRNYNTYFNDAVKNAVLKQNLNQVFRNQRGVMLGQGQLWLTEYNGNILIIAINH